MQGGEQLEWGVLGEPVHHRGALPLACGDEVAVVRHVADLGPIEPADAASSSGKAKKARDLGIAILRISEFLDLVTE